MKERRTIFPSSMFLRSSAPIQHFFTSFGARDRTYMMMFRLWQNALLEKVSTEGEVDIERLEPKSCSQLVFAKTGEVSVLEWRVTASVNSPQTSCSMPRKRG